MEFDAAYAEMLQEQRQQVGYIHPLLSGAEFMHARPNSRWYREYHHLQEMSFHFHWLRLPQPLVSELHDPAVAVLITDKRQNLCWVNEGFTRLTGYEKTEVLGRSPAFLQGKNTQEKDKVVFRTKLAVHKPFTHTVLNYRKDGSSYRCKIWIYPMLNKAMQLQHYLAVERALE